MHAVAKRWWFQPKFWRFEPANCKLGSVGVKQIREYREGERARADRENGREGGRERQRESERGCYMVVSTRMTCRVLGRRRSTVLFSGGAW